MKKLFILFAAITLGFAASAQNPVQWDTEKFFQAPKARPLHSMDTCGVKAVLLEGLDYKGEKTQFFAYYALPEGASAENPVPAMVFIHGGGGSAFWEWCKVWRDLGYAAISMDTTGKFPLRLPGDPFHKTYGNWALLPGGLHLEWGGFDKGFDPVEEQWPYIAVAEVMLAHSFIASLPEVDANRTGLIGNSWGGYLTLITAAVDTRFKFAAPIYACGYFDECNHTMRARGTESFDRWLKLWDPKYYIPNIPMPTFWAAGTNEGAFEFAAIQKSYDICTTAPLYKALRKNMVHTDGFQLEGRPIEAYAMADHYLKGEPLSLPQVLYPELTKKGKVQVAYETGGREIAKVELFYTKASEGLWRNREWEIVELPLPTKKDKNTITAAVPEGAKTVFFNLTTKEGYVATSYALYL